MATMLIPPLMLKVFWGALAASFIAFVVLMFQVGIGPRPISVITPSLAKEPAEVGYWVYRQLRHIVFKHQVILWGYQNERVHAEVVKGFWESAKKDAQEIDLLIRLKGSTLSLPVRTTEVTDAKNVLAILPQLLASARRVIVFLPSQETSHVVKDSVAQKLETLINTSVMSVSALDWNPNHEAETLVNEHCEEAKNLTGFPDFNFFHCIYRNRKSKLVKTKQPDKVEFVVDQYGASDYLVLVYP